MADGTWHAGLEVGHGPIDADHRSLFEALTRLEAAAGEGADRAAVAEALGFLRDYTVRHFSVEEGLMLRHSYPKASSHLAAHATLLMKVSDFQADQRAGRPVSLPALVAFLRAWLEEHIQVNDAELGRFLTGLGLQV